MAAVAQGRGGVHRGEGVGRNRPPGTGPVRPLLRSLGWGQEDPTAGLEAAKGKSHTFSSQVKKSNCVVMDVNQTHWVIL